MWGMPVTSHVWMLVADGNVGRVNMWSVPVDVARADVVGRWKYMMGQYVGGATLIKELALACAPPFISWYSSRDPPRRPHMHEASTRQKQLRNASLVPSGALSLPDPHHGVLGSVHPEAGDGRLHQRHGHQPPHMSPDGAHEGPDPRAREDGNSL